MKVQPLSLFASSLFFLLSTTALANSWAERIVSCDGARLERICWNNDYSYIQCRVQFYVESEYAKTFLVNTGLLQYNQKYEVILPELMPISGSRDLVDRSDAYRVNGRISYLKPLSDNILQLEVFRTTQPSGGIFTQEEKLGEYLFHSCQ